MRKCETCGRVFHLEREGVRPSDKPAPELVVGAPIAGGAYAIAGVISVGRNAKWRIGRGW